MFVPRKTKPRGHVPWQLDGSEGFGHSRRTRFGSATAWRQNTKDRIDEKVWGFLGVPPVLIYINFTDVFSIKKKKNIHV